jgi:hypothetical protein
LPFGTGIWLAGTSNVVATRNEVVDNSAFGVLVSRDLAGVQPPIGNRVQGNSITSAEALDLAWDGAGSNDCFGGNSFTTSGPEDIEAMYPCSERPFDGVPYPPVIQALDNAVAGGPAGEPTEPPEPDRPRCQRGRPGCRK